MNPNETRTFFISVGLAVLAMFMFYSYSQNKQDEYNLKHGATKSVVVAKEDINEMATINESMLDIVQVPGTYLQPGALEDPELAIGQVAAAPIKKDEQILRTKLLNPGPLTGISLQVAPDMRAVTIPVDEIRGVARLIRPGDRIDLLAALDYGKGMDQRREVRTILQDVAVLATGLRIVNQAPRLLEKDPSGNSVQILNLNGDTSFSTITVEVNPRDAQDLVYILATSPGGLFVTLRNPNDRQKPTMAIATIDTVLRKIDRNAIASEIRAPASVMPVPAPMPAPPKAMPKKKPAGPYIEL